MAHRSQLDHQPALDGLRAFAVIAVLLFHGGVPGFGGGYLGVSVFFTLSGFLITRLLIDEYDATGGIDLAHFYGRRLRRLLPASALCLIGVALLGVLTGVFDGVSALRAQMVGAVLQVANWVSLAGDGSYQELLGQASGTTSPLEHFWSLAIEEQFYWLWPPAMVVILRRYRSSSGRTAVIGIVTALAMVAAPLTAIVWGADAAYWSTPARAGEILVGALLAALVCGRTITVRAGKLATFGVATLVTCIITFPSTGGPAYSGALPLIGLASAGLILGLQTDGPVRRALSRSGPVWIGQISYGLYLFHWPLFVVLDETRVGFGGPVLFAVRLLATFAAAVLSYRFVEAPIRRADLRPRFTFGGAVTATASICVIAALAVPAGLGQYWLTDAATVQAASIDAPGGLDVDVVPLVELDTSEATVSAADAATAGATTAGRDAHVIAGLQRERTRMAEPDLAAAGSSTPSSVPSSTVDTAVDTTVDAAVVTTVDTTVDTTVVAPTAPPRPQPEPLPELLRPVRILVGGDSTAHALGNGMVQWAARHPDLARVNVVPAPGCGFVRGGDRRLGEMVPNPTACEDYLDEFLVPAVSRLRPDVVMLMVTSWDLVDRRWDTDEAITPLDAAYADRIARDYRMVADALTAAGAGRVAWVRQPIPNVYWQGNSDDQEDPARHQVVYDIYDGLERESPDQLAVIALDRWMIDTGLAVDTEARPDGIHLRPDAATDVAERFLGDQIIRVALRVTR